MGNYKGCHRELSIHNFIIRAERGDLINLIHEIATSSAFGVLLAMTLFCSLPVFAEGPHAFPVPFTPGKDASHTGISFTNLPGTGSIQIYTIDGLLVVTLPIAPGQSLLDWRPVTNTRGEKVATGVYIYRLDDGTTGKLVVIR